jgi:N-acetylglucosamine kinase-like BadF-type ATPase
MALAALEAATQAAFAAAGQKRHRVQAACLGLAGAGRATDHRILREWASRFELAQTVDIIEDAALLLAAGTPAGWGLAVVAGTGSMAYGRCPDGRTARSGGWGPVLGDEGSGYAIALAGLRAVVRAADGRGPATNLTAALLTALELGHPEQLVGLVYEGGNRAALAALAPTVLEIASRGDRVAEEIVTTAVTELASAVVATAKALRLGNTFPLALAGGLLIASASYRERFLTTLSGRGLTADPTTLVCEPAEGAVRLALAACNRS